MVNGRVVIGRFVVFLALMLSVMLVAHSTSAQAVYTPLQKAHAGLWFDPAFNGQGVDLTVVDPGPGQRTAFAIVYGGVVGGVPAWFHATGTPSRGGTTLTLRATAEGFGLPSSGASAPVGVLTLRPLSCNALAATFSVGQGPVVEWRLQRVVASPAECYTCVMPDFSPTPPGCGF